MNTMTVILKFLQRYLENEKESIWASYNFYNCSDNFSCIRYFSIFILSEYKNLGLIKVYKLKIL